MRLTGSLDLEATMFTTTREFTTTVCALAHRLAMEINAGVSFEQDTLTTLLAIGAVTARTKRGALRQAVRLIRETYPEYEPSESITRALLGTSTKFGRG